MWHAWPWPFASRLSFLALVVLLPGGCALHAFRPLVVETARGVSHPVLEACLREVGERFGAFQHPWQDAVMACIGERLAALPVEASDCHRSAETSRPCTAWIGFRFNDLTFSHFTDNRYEIAVERQAGGEVTVELTSRQYWDNGRFVDLKQSASFRRP
ncbi:hypothetical protein [Falsiroseomonas sp.]|uniref:hypothetical protein n=1 Tax=Falsiroseomonas sp. TaxID=2870721 RepID=UPI003F6F0AD5